MASPAVSVRRQPVRCAIYTRKSTEEGLDQDFNSLDAQRLSAEAYILSQRQEGWLALPHLYNDGGFTGANMERPGLRQLLGDIEAGRIDCVVVCKVDRLSRSLLDFARILGTFESHGVSFVSVTQQFNTSVPVGRLTLNILLSFAEFEREIIGERTREKKSAARKKGKWTGGYVPLGYDLDPRGGRLVVNEREAARVQAIFELFADRRSIEATLVELEQRGWTTKGWRTRKQTEHKGGAFTEASLVRLLNNVLYTGWVSYHGQLYQGEQPGIVSTRLWKKVNAILAKEQSKPARKDTNKFGRLLQGILRCSACGQPLAVTCTRNGERHYHYYFCRHGRNQNGVSCASRYVSAEVIEHSVIEKLKASASYRPAVRKLAQLYRATPPSPTPPELLLLMRSLLDSVHYDGQTGEVTIQLRRPKEDRHARS